MKIDWTKCDVVDDAHAKFKQALGHAATYGSVGWRSDGALVFAYPGDYTCRAFITLAMLDDLSIVFGTRRIDLDLDAGHDEPSHGGGGMGHIRIIVHQYRRPPVAVTTP